MTGLHASLVALLDPGVAPDGEPLPEWVHVDELRRLLAEHPADLPVATAESPFPSRAQAVGAMAYAEGWLSNEHPDAAHYLRGAIEEIADAMVDDECARIDLPVATDSTTAVPRPSETDLGTALDVLLWLSEDRVGDGRLRDAIARVRSELHEEADR